MSGATTEAPHPAFTAALVVTLRLRPGVEANFSSWHARMSTAPASAAGFVSAEVNAPAPGELEWRVVQRFRNVSYLQAWRASELHGRLIREGSELVEGGDGSGLREHEISDGVANGVVTEVVTTYVKPGKDQEYQAWAEKIHQAEAEFPGYRGSYLQPPASQRQHYWTTLVRFATPEQLDRWLSSDVRKAFLHQHEELVQSWEHHRLPSSFSGWFPTDAATSESPSSWKQSMIVILMLFPIVMLEIRFLSPLLGGMSTSPATFIGNVISVVLLAWPFMPLAIAAMKWWLLPGKDSPKWTNALGVALLVGLYAMEITVLSWLV
jgi:antibiotic biosynthesis monooxygenase (ABM) superfamily enzyme